MLQLYLWGSGREHIIKWMYSAMDAGLILNDCRCSICTSAFQAGLNCRKYVQASALANGIYSKFTVMATYNQTRQDLSRKAALMASNICRGAYPRSFIVPFNPVYNLGISPLEQIWGFYTRGICSNTSKKHIIESSNPAWPSF